MQRAERPLLQRIRQPQSSLRRYLTIPNLSLAFVLMCCATIGMLEQYEAIISAAIVVAILINWKREEFYLFSATFLLYWEQFYLIAGSTPVFRIYFYLLLIRFVLDLGKVRFRPQFIPVVLIFVAFCLFSVPRINPRLGLTMMVDAVLCFAITVYIRQNSDLLRKFTVMFVLTAICAGLYSLQAKTLVTYETGLGAQVSIVRYYGTVGDANYAGLFYDLAFFYALCSNSFRKWYFRLPVLGILGYFIVLTGSQTALLCLFIGLCVYIVLRYRLIGLPLVFLVLIAAVVGVYAIINVPALRENEILSTIANRLVQSFSDLQKGDMESLTTERMSRWLMTIDYFKALPWYNQLIGGKVVTMLVSDEFFLEVVPAIHQTYLQGVIDFGIIGALIVFGVRFVQTGADVFNCLCRRKTELSEDMLRCVIMTSYAFMLYALTMDLFMDWRALFLFYL